MNNAIPFHVLDIFLTALFTLTTVCLLLFGALNLRDKSGGLPVWPFLAALSLMASVPCGVVTIFLWMRVLT